MFLEEHVRPKVHQMRRLFQLEYLHVYDEWSKNEVHNQQTEDTRKIQTFVEIADTHAGSIASRYRIRLLLHALRTLPLQVLGLVSGFTENQSILATIMAATSAVRRHGQQTMPTELDTRNGVNSLQITDQELRDFRDNLGVDLARLLGAAFAQQTGETAYRLAGKGGQLVRPTRVPESVWTTFEDDSYPYDAILLLPSPDVQISSPILKAVEQYEKRRDAQQIPAGSGLFFSVADRSDSNDFNWWAFTWPRSPLESLETRVAYPSLDRTFVSTSYGLQPIDVHRFLDLFRSFAEPFHERMGFTDVDFIDCCWALFQLIGEQTGYWRLQKERSTSKRLRLVSELRADENIVSTIALHLHGVLSRGYLRAPGKAFIEGIVRWLSFNGHTSAEETAIKFVTRFTDTVETIGPFKPMLFYRIDPELLVLDGFLMEHFFDACLRVVTEGDGTVGNLRAKAFENLAREAIISDLALTESEIPFPPGRDLVLNGINYGDVDFSFVRNGLLINLDMKAWQRSEKYFRGEFRAIDNRQKTLVKYLNERVAPRGQQLFDRIRREGRLDLRGVVNFLCVPVVEYVSPQYPELWSGFTPRVLTPLEIVSFVKNGEPSEDLVDV